MGAEASVPSSASDVATPPSRQPVLSGRRLPAVAARIGAAIGSLLGRPVRIRNTVIAIRHADVVDLLARDLDFRIAPVNEAKIDSVNGGPFVLGMDRGCRLGREREALYRALAEVNLRWLETEAKAEAASRLPTADGEVDVVAAYARPVAAHTAKLLFGVGAEAEPTLFMDVARAIFAHTFLNQSDDPTVAGRATRAARLMRVWLEAEIARRRAADVSGPDMMGALLRNKWLDDDAVRRTLGGMLVGSVDTTAAAVAKIVATVASNRKLAIRMEADLDRPERLAGWCLDVLRRWPHNPILIRRAAADTTFGPTAVRKGDTMVAWTQAAMLDPTVFPRPGHLRPDRPGATYLHFGGGVHPCAGRAVNAFQIPLLVGGLLRRGIASARPIEWAGPFPDHLVVRLREPA